MWCFASLWFYYEFQMASCGPFTYGRQCSFTPIETILKHDDVIKWKHFPRNWPFVRGIHRSPVNSPHKSQWRGALMFSLICVWINDWVNNREAGDLRRYRSHYDVSVMLWVNRLVPNHNKAQKMQSVCIFLRRYCRTLKCFEIRLFLVQSNMDVNEPNVGKLTQW